MLERLRIENLILIRKADIRFGSRLNILTGESGAGKSAILAAIRLLCGERGDLQMLRDPAKPAVIEGEVRCTVLDPDLFSGEESCTLRREILPSGKTRAFCNDRLIPLAELKKLSLQTIEFADQNEARDLLSSASQRSLLDQWAAIPIAAFARSFALQQKTASDLAQLKVDKEKACLAGEIAKDQIAEIEDVAWKEEEEETLVKEHDRCARASEHLAVLASVQSELTELALPSLLRKMATRLPIPEAAALLTNASVEINEAERLLETSAIHFDTDPHAFEKIEKRIAQIEKIKRKYGKSHKEVTARLTALKNDLIAFELIDEKIAFLENEYKHLLKENQKTATDFSDRRKKEAKRLQGALQEELRTLHLPHARFEIAIEPKPLGADGYDAVRFLFSANEGQPLQPLEECASGGEQSRVFFAFKLVLATKEERSLLVLDEIDSNIGGIAASILGEKLKELGNSRQIICITHFAQAAQHAHSHLLVEKTADAQTLIRSLTDAERQREYIRMTGGRLFC